LIQILCIVEVMWRSDRRGRSQTPLGCSGPPHLLGNRRARPVGDGILASSEPSPAGHLALPDPCRARTSILGVSIVPWLGGASSSSRAGIDHRHAAVVHDPVCRQRLEHPAGRRSSIRRSGCRHTGPELRGQAW